MDTAIIPHAVVYCRVSTDDQRENGTSLDSQEAACLKYAEANGYRVVEVFKESKSGASLNRPMLDKVREMVRQGVVQAVIFYALDRLSRDETDTLILAREFRSHGVDLRCATVALEDTPQGQFLMTLLAAVGKLERAAILERTTRGKRTKARNGISSGQIMRPPATIYGYAYNDGTYELVPVEAYRVRQVFEWYLHDGLALGAIAQRLTALGVPTRKGGRWAGPTILNLVTQEAYIGEYWWGKHAASRGHKRSVRPRSEWIGPIPVPAIVPREYHEAVLARLEYNKQNSTRNCKTEYLLRGMIVCPKCGRRYRGERSPKKRGTPRMDGMEHVNTYYECSRRSQSVPGDDCNAPRINGRRAEEDVWEWAIAYLSDPDLIRNIMEGSDESEQAARHRDEHDLRALLKERAVLDEDENQLIDLYSKGGISFEKFMERKEVRDERAKGIEAAVREIEERQTARRRAREDAKNAIEIVKKVQRGLPRLGLGSGRVSFADKRAVLEALHIKVTPRHPRPDGQGAHDRQGLVDITGYISSDLLALADLDGHDGRDGHDGGDEGYHEEDSNHVLHKDAQENLLGDAAVHPLFLLQVGAP